MTVIIAGERSGSGKTTVTLSLLAALRSMGERVQSFKVGPDYIDPMFHAYATGRPCYNLDPVLTSEAYLDLCLRQRTADVPLAVIEGVMGLFDGAVEPAGYGSTAFVAARLNLPILLTIDCRSLSHSIAAIVHGYRSFNPDLKLAGAILNRVGSDRQLEILTAALAPLNIPILGVFKRESEISLPDRYLGLIPTDELLELKQIIDRLAAIGRAAFDWDKLTPLLSKANDRADSQSGFLTKFHQYENCCNSDKSELNSSISVQIPVRIGIARDAAFNFYYADNLDTLTKLGAELVEWSPLKDSQLPENIHGWYFGGGFPELFAAELAANIHIRSSLKRSISSGTPTYAECGGLMYLSTAIVDFAGEKWPMVDILPTTAVMGNRLTLGYRSAITQADTPLLSQGAIVRGHEFHRSSLSVAPTQPLYQTAKSAAARALLHAPQFPEGWHSPHLHASYLHLHWGDNWQLPQRFLATALKSSKLSDIYLPLNLSPTRTDLSY